MISKSQILEKKDQVVLTAAIRALDKVERTIKDLEEKKKIINPTLIQDFQRRSNSVERDFKKAKDKLAKLPAGASKVKPVQDRLESLDKSWTALQNFYNSAGDNNANAEAEWATVKESEQYQKDKETINVYVKKLSSSLKLKVETPNGAWIRNQLPDYYEERLGMIQNWDKIKQEIATFRNTYAKFEPYPGDPMPQIKNIERYILEREKDLQVNTKNGITLLENRYEKLKTQIDDAKVRHQGAINYGQKYTGIDEMILATNSFPRQTLREAERVVELISAYDSSFKSKSKNTLSALQSTYEEAANFAAEYTMASKEKPVNEYTAGDFDQLVALVKQRFSGQKIIGVYLESSWGLTEEYRYDASYGSVRKVKYSTLNGKVYLALDSEFALERYIYIQKDHLNGNALRLFGDFREYGVNPPLRVKFPMAKF